MKIFNMLKKHFVGNSDANENCLLIFKDSKEVKDSSGYFPDKLPYIFMKEVIKDDITYTELKVPDKHTLLLSKEITEGMLTEIDLIETYLDQLEMIDISKNQSTIKKEIK